MPWVPELFSAPALERFEEMAVPDRPGTVPFFAGLLAGEMDALIGSFSGAPELYLPVQGRVRGRRAFEQYVSEMTEWFQSRNATVVPVSLLLTERCGCEESVMHLDSEQGPIVLPVAVLSDHRDGTRLDELRVYFSNWQLSGGHRLRTPLLQHDGSLEPEGVVGAYQRALAAGDADGILACFEPDGYAREPAGAEYVHSGPEELRAFYESLFSNGGGIPLEHCAIVDDGSTCAIEYNVARWGRSELPPQAGVAVYVRGPAGRLAAARIYDDVDAPIVR
jgi:SnoaL-like domain